MESGTAVCFTDMHRLPEIKWRNGAEEKKDMWKLKYRSVWFDAGQEEGDAMFRETPRSDRINTGKFATVW